MLTNLDRMEVAASVATLNVVMSAYAERGAADTVLQMLDDFSKVGLDPDANSFSFAIEALGKDLHRRNKGYETGLVAKNLDAADSILSKMEAENVEPTSDIIRNYVELLCLAGEVETATGVVEDILQREQSGLLNDKILYRVAMANIEISNLDAARKLASATGEHVTKLHRVIKSQEQRLQNLQLVQKKQETQEEDTENGKT